MILPIMAYGEPVLRKIAKDIDKNYPNLDKLIEDMFETMYATNGVGLAAPQINKSIRLIVLDPTPFAELDGLSDEEKKNMPGKKVLINARMLDEFGDEWAFTEGCLSIPNINEDVRRHDTIEIEYYDENFKKHTEEISGILARVIQHEYDHLEGIMFTDHLSPIKKRLLKRKLENISKGKIDVDYRMKFPKKK